MDGVSWEMRVRLKAFWLLGVGGLALAFGGLAGGLALAEESADGGLVDAEKAAEAALARVEADAKERGVSRRGETSGLNVRSSQRVGVESPIYRSGVPYFDEWTVRAGALKLRVPAYQGWQAVKQGSEFYQAQTQFGRPGELLVLPIMNRDFVRATRSKYVNFYGLIWVPQEQAFVSLVDEDFAAFEQRLQKAIVADRKRRVERDDFWNFEDYIAFRKGRDEDLEESLDGYWLKALDEPDLVSYFAVSEFVHESRRGVLRQPMIQTMTYALVRGKLLRFDFKRLYLTDEDPAALISFTRKFVEDMRVVNGLSERKLR